MKVSDAVSLRASIRAFTNQEVDSDLIKEILQKSSRSASGGNLQPWRIYVINKKMMDNFLTFQKEWTKEETPAYEIYPKKLKEPYRNSRYELGEQMYKILNIAREDKAGRFEQVLKNFNFFGAPVGMFCFIDKQMGLPQWSDLGMFLQTFMLLAVDNNLDTCAQESWSLKQNCVKTYLDISDDCILFCGMAIGHANIDDKVNELNTPRRPIDEWATFVE